MIPPQGRVEFSVNVGLMQNKLRQQLRAACVLGIVAVLGLLALAYLQEALWVGSADLTVEFVVVDAGTGEPVQGAEISIQSLGGWNAVGDRMKSTGLQSQEFKLGTDDTGTARYLCRDSWTTGRDSNLPFRNTYHVRLPYWSVTTRATGYVTGEPFSLDEPQYRVGAKRIAPRQAKLVVPISLQKAQP